LGARTIGDDGTVSGSAERQDGDPNKSYLEAGNCKRGTETSVAGYSVFPGYELAVFLAQ
jgi:hypothetical protein